MIQDEKGVYDLYSTLYKPFWSTSWFWYFCGFLVFIVSIFLFFYLISHFKKHIKRRFSLRAEVVKQLRHMKQQQTNRFYIQNSYLFYQELGLVFRTFLTSIHQVQLTHLTEVELSHHMSECKYCLTLYIESCMRCKQLAVDQHNIIKIGNMHFLTESEKHFHDEFVTMLNRIYTVKYTSEIVAHELASKDFQFVISLVSYTYNQKI
ncbi:hypothetical protein IPH25_00880 [bacterium]|nr:MAG: hypothetical protein IPG37_03000 [bacterium]QQR61980.1 MAG: hypothetical protein IPH25_00880 [bacterium]